MPARLRLLLLPQEPIPLEELKPDRLHGLFFSCAGSLAQELHKNSVKPFSLSFYVEVEGRRRLLRAGLETAEPIKKIFLEVSFLEESFFPRFLSTYILDKKELKLGKTPLRALKKPLIKDRDVISYESIVEDFPSGSKIRLDFLTPTTFKKGKNEYPLPDPKLIFRGLVKKWTIFSGIRIEPDLREAMEQEVMVSGHYIQTQKVELSSLGFFVGFVGSVYLTFPQKDREEIRWLKRLIRFSEFAGVGRKTAMGFGTIRFKEVISEEDTPTPLEG